MRCKASWGDGTRCSARCPFPFAAGQEPPVEEANASGWRLDTKALAGAAGAWNG